MNKYTCISLNKYILLISYTRPTSRPGGRGGRGGGGGWGHPRGGKFS